MDNVLRHRTGLPVKVETREDGRPVISGYASVFYRAGDPGTEYRMYEDVVERIMPGAFDRAIAEGDDVRGLFNHQPSQILGRTKSGTVRLSVDERGLRYEIDPPDTQVARDVLELIKRGDVSASSFGFMPDQTVYRDEKIEGRNVYVIERQTVRLFDVSPVTFPAYEGTEVAIRGTDDEREQARREVERWKAGQWCDDLLAIRCRARAVEVAIHDNE